MPDPQLMDDVTTELTFADRTQRERQWTDTRQTVWAWHDSNSHTGWHYWEYGKDRWTWHGLVVHLHGPFRLIPSHEEIDECATGWVIEV